MTTKTVKAVNWSAEAVAVLSTEYTGSNLGELATKLGKSEHAVRGKLVSMGIYKTKEAVAKTATAKVSRKDLVTELASALGVTVEQVISLEKAKHDELAKLVNAVKMLKGSANE